MANWTIFEQLVTGLRDIQKKELLNPGVQKKVRWIVRFGSKHPHNPCPLFADKSGRWISQ